MSSTNPVLSDRDVNAPVGSTDGAQPAQAGGGPVASKGLEYQRQMFRARLGDEKANQQYVSPSDGIMSPCSAKLSAYRNKHMMKAKPQTLFGKGASAAGGGAGSIKKAQHNSTAGVASASRLGGFADVIPATPAAATPASAIPSAAAAADISKKSTDESNNTSKKFGRSSLSSTSSLSSASPN